MAHEFMTVAEVADHLRVSKGTVIRMIKDGVLVAIKPGRDYRIRTASYMAFLTARTQNEAALREASDARDEVQYRLEEQGVSGDEVAEVLAAMESAGDV